MGIRDLSLISWLIKVNGKTLLVKLKESIVVNSWKNFFPFYIVELGGSLPISTLHISHSLSSTHSTRSMRILCILSQGKHPNPPFSYRRERNVK